MADINQANKMVSELQSIASELSTVKSMIDNVSRELKGGWTGVSYNSFKSTSDRLQNDITGSISDLNRLAETVRTASLQLSLKKN